MKERKNILAIGAHPDDLEISCSGTLAAYAKNGNNVFMYYATDGDKGGIEKTKDEIREIRKKESSASAKVIGASSFGGDFHDTEIAVNLVNRLIIIDVIRQCNPDIVITHFPGDYHTDHINLSRLVFEASYIAGIPKLETKHKATKNFPHLFYMDTICGIGFEPKEYVDISDFFEIKIEMMKKHKSQLNFINDISGIDFLDMIEICSRFRGYQCNTKYAEGFIECAAWPRGATKRLLP